MKENPADIHESLEDFQIQDGPKAVVPMAGRNGFYSAVIEDSSVQASMQSWIEMDCYQLSRGSRIAQMDCLDLGNQQIVRESQQAAVQKQGVTPPNLCTISYCTTDPRCRFSELDMAKDETVFFLPENTEFDIFVPAGIQTAYISLDQEEFLNSVRVLNPTAWERTPQQLLAIDTAQQGVLKETVNRWLKMAEMDVVSSSHMLTEQIHSMLLQNVLQVAASTGLDDLRPSIEKRKRALSICRKTCDFIEDSLASDIVPTVVDICKLIGVSERTLQYAFRSYVDMPPNVYLRFRRLNRVRAILRASDPQSTTVTTVAMRFGFLHLGRFAHEYRQLFNESPSKTLAS
ncbi:helix-turn-helix domain-containing protein [Thiomicrorhabdus sp.]|uniref:helix-turn-helix domain-containing protein n=1 Tax=Thiomicrorhabdus sp. TaxID=2039724 RepID=UPI0035618D90